MEVGGYRIRPTHGGKYHVGAVLQRQMEVRRDPLGLREIDDVGCAVHRFERADPEECAIGCGVFDSAQQVSPISALTLRSRLAWAHSWVSNPSLNPVFQALPGASFTVTGAAPAKDLVLASAGFDLNLTSGVTLSGKFDGEFGENTKIFSGTASLRYRW